MTEPAPARLVARAGSSAASTPDAGRLRPAVGLAGRDVVIGLVAAYSFGSFVLHDGSLIFQVVMAWPASIAMEPAVSRLERHMRRGLATGVVMVGVVVFAIGFCGGAATCSFRRRSC